MQRPMSIAANAAQRVQLLQQCFAHIERTRMAGVPVLNQALHVAAVDFAPEMTPAPGSDAVLYGVLVTPWFMNLVRLPMDAAAAAGMAGVGVRVARTLGQREFDFLGCHETQVGAFESCSLFSPMFEFIDQVAAETTAREVLRQLREVSPPVTPQPASPARRGFLFGRAKAVAVEPR